MKEKARTLAETDLIAGPEEVRQAIASLTEGESVKLRRLAEGSAYRLRRRVWATDANDILNEAILRVLQTKRHWKPERVDFVGLIAGTISSIESDWRKRGKRGETPVLETDLPTMNSEGETMPNAIQQAGDDHANPERQLIDGEELTQEQLIGQIEQLFSEDSLAALIFSEWRRGSKGPEIMKALDMARQDYDTTVRRMDRAIEKRWPEGMPYVR
jgi:DNA-directed RNA polymerase specialized sigma24 family protein